MSVPVLEVPARPWMRPFAWATIPTTAAFWLVAVLAVGIGLRLLLLDARSLWYDEAASLYFAGQSLPDVVWLTITRDTPPPLYYLVLHGWMRLFGDSVTAVRLLSAIFSAACLPLLYLLARPLAGRLTALVATGLLAISPFHIWYAQEARMYALLALTGLASCLALLRLVQAPGRGRWLVYVVATAAMLWTHYLALFVLVAQALVVITIGLRWQPSARQRWWTWSAVVAGGLTLVPWLPAFVIQSRTYSRFWIPPATPEILERALYEFSANYAPYWRLPGDRPGLVAAGFLALAVAGVLALRRGRVAWLLPLALALVPLLLAYLVGTLRPLFLTRTLIMLTPAYYLLIAAGLVWLGRRWWPVALLGVGWVLVWSGLGLVNMYRTPKEPWNEAARYVAERSQPGEIILFHSAPSQWPFEYYYRALGPPLETHGVPRDIEQSQGALEHMVTVADLARVDAYLATGRPIWLVLRDDNGFVDPDQLVVRHLDARRTARDHQAFDRIDVRRYAP